MLLPIFLYTYNLTRGDYETLSFCYGVNEVFALLGRYTVVIGSCLALEIGPISCLKASLTTILHSIKSQKSTDHLIMFSNIGMRYVT